MIALHYGRMLYRDLMFYWHNNWNFNLESGETMWGRFSHRNSGKPMPPQHRIFGSIFHVIVGLCLATWFAIKLIG